ncbi:MAG: hypothetical protein F6K17_43245 [Okeania sp. SIO3C4]|nr:hypothetical protein [Okeania sp. SIO3C4]
MNELSIIQKTYDLVISRLVEDPRSPEGERRDGKTNQFCGFVNSVFNL